MKYLARVLWGVEFYLIIANIKAFNAFIEGLNWFQVVILVIVSLIVNIALGIIAFPPKEYK